MTMEALQRIEGAEGSDLVDEGRLATRLGVSRATLQSWRYSGRGPRYLKIGRLIRYRNTDVEAYLRGQTRGALNLVR
jgi:predicted DNA-binding transcriptional regulator AlpA